MAVQLKRTAAVARRPEGVLVQQDGRCSSGVRWGRLVVAHGCLLPPGAARPSEGPLRLLPRPPGGRPRVLGGAGGAAEEGRVLAAWRCPLLAASVRRLAADGWSLERYDPALLLVLQVGDGANLGLSEVTGLLRSLLSEHVAEPRQGQSVVLEATPFGAGNFFLNTWTKGIVTKVAGSEGCLVLSDAHAAPGSEGGGLYSEDDGQPKLVGLVVQTVLTVRGESVSLCLCASAKTILASALDVKLEKIDQKPATDDSSHGVALLRNSGSWASAVCIDSEKGIFLTCAHVLQGAKNDSVQLEWLSSGGPQIARILHKCPSNSAFDVALLKTAAKGPKRQHAITKYLPSKGDVVNVIGYGLLSPPGPGRALHSPMVSRGCVSQSRPHMLQTSCTVQSGSSGGAVLRGSQLVGLVVGHTELTAPTHLQKNWPKINFAVPIAAIAEPIEEFLKTGDVGVLRRLDNCDPAMTALWTLNALPNSKL